MNGQQKETPRQKSASAAEVIFGAKRYTDRQKFGRACIRKKVVVWDGEGGPDVYHPQISRSWRLGYPADDMLVLRHVNDKWDVLPDGRPDPRRINFLRALNRILWHRAFGDSDETMPSSMKAGRLGDLGYILGYQAGDYAAAALEAVQEISR